MNSFNEVFQESLLQRNNEIKAFPATYGVYIKYTRVGGGAEGFSVFLKEI